MVSYKDSGVDIALGNESSVNAKDICERTHNVRAKMAIGYGPIKAGLKNDFSEILDFGEYCITQNSDGIGSKIKIAEQLNKYNTIGHDLLAMVADDAVCVGAETVYLSNIIDIDQVAPHITDKMLLSLARACIQNKVIISGGEIAELPGIVDGVSWNASSIGIVDKDKIITSNFIAQDDVILGLRSNGFRSNGFTLLRHILMEVYGKRWYLKEFDGKTWGDIVLTPSIIYSTPLLSFLGRFGEKRKIPIKGIAHITGGGIKNIKRILNGLGCIIDNPLKPHDAMIELQRIGQVSDEEAYKTWNMGMGMFLILDKKHAGDVMLILKDQFNIDSDVIGVVIKQYKEQTYIINSKGLNKTSFCF